VPVGGGEFEDPLLGPAWQEAEDVAHIGPGGVAPVKPDRLNNLRLVVDHWNRST
jgi:hypothetical protein